MIATLVNDLVFICLFGWLVGCYLFFDILDCALILMFEDWLNFCLDLTLTLILILDLFPGLWNKHPDLYVCPLQNCYLTQWLWCDHRPMADTEIAANTQPLMSLPLPGSTTKLKKSHHMLPWLIVLNSSCVRIVCFNMLHKWLVIFSYDSNTCLWNQGGWFLFRTSRQFSVLVFLP